MATSNKVKKESGAKLKTLAPGIVLRSGRRGKTLRFSCMINGTRFSQTCATPAELLLDDRNRPTVDLRSEYNMWVEKCGRQVGKVMSHGLRIPTIKELINTYEEIATKRGRDPNYRKPTENFIRGVVLNYGYCKNASGLRDEQPYTMLMDTDMIRRIFDSFAARMHGISAWTYVSALQSVTASWTIVKYRDLGFKVEPPVMPDVGNARRPPEYQMLSPEMKAKIEAWYTDLANDSDRRLYLAASIVAQLAVRPLDVRTLTAQNFIKRPEEDHVHLVYKPHKTRESSNRRVDWPIRPALWELICDVAGERLRAGETILENGRSVFDRLNKSMRDACGMKEWNKAVYELRKLCIDTVRREQGVDAAVALSGDRRDTIDRYYSDPYKLVGITPIEILPLAPIPAKSVEAVPDVSRVEA